VQSAPLAGDARIVPKPTKDINDKHRVAKHRRDARRTTLHNL
jgi:hypothetical protein